MDIIEPTPSQAAVALKKFLECNGCDLKLSVAQEALARSRGYASFHALVSNVPHRGERTKKPGKLQSAADDLLWVISGRNHGADDDTVEILWAADETTAAHEFKLRVCGYANLPEIYAFSDDMERPIFICSTTLVGRLVEGRFVLEGSCVPPQTTDADTGLPAVTNRSPKDLENALREEYDRHSEYNDPADGGGTFEKMVKLFAGDPRYSLHQAARRYMGTAAAQPEVAAQQLPPELPPMYWVRRVTASHFELRQLQYRESFLRGIEHPHDVCAIGRSVDELRGMVGLYRLGPVDWTVSDAK